MKKQGDTRADTMIDLEPDHLRQRTQAATELLEQVDADTDLTDEDRKAITRWPSWRDIFADGLFSIRALVAMMLAAVAIIAVVVEAVTILVIAINLLGGDAGLTTSYAITLFVGAIAVQWAAQIIVKAI